METLVGYIIGAIITYLGGMSAIKRGWWKRSGSCEEDGMVLEWNAGIEDSMFIALVWFLILPILVIFGAISVILKWGKWTERTHPV